MTTRRGDACGDPVAAPLHVQRTRLLLPAMVAVLLAVGVLGSVMGAWQVHRTVEQGSRQTFQASTARIASTLKLAILREQDFAVGAAVFVRNPQTTEAAEGVDRMLADRPLLAGTATS